MIVTQATDLLEKILSGDADRLTNEEITALEENRQEIVESLIPSFSEEIPCLSIDGRCDNPDALVWGLRLAALLEASEAFEWLQKICHISIKTLNQFFGEDFVDELPYLLCHTIDQWTALKVEIEDPLLDEFIRSGCLEALVFSVAEGRIPRIEITDYFKTLFHRILSEEIDDVVLSTHLVSSCAHLWPGECLEEIRELFGLSLIDDELIDISSVLESFMQGEEKCIEQLKKQIEQLSFFKKPQPLSDDEPPQKWKNVLHRIEKAEMEADQAFNPQRNEVCPCGSGKKYKKCCMNKPAGPSTLRIESSTISYVALKHDTLDALSESERESILDLYYLVDQNPEKVLEIAPTYIAKYPDIPMLYNYLYGAYKNLNFPHKAMKVLRETLEIFPDYLFARIQHARYLLRRGESEKAHAALNNARTLPQLYPDRAVFHAAEWNSFAYTMGLLSVQQDDIDQAKIYLQLVQQLDSQSPETESLEKKIKGKLFAQALRRQQSGVRKVKTSN